MRALILTIVLLASLVACSPSAASGQRTPSFSEVSAAASGQSSSSTSRQAQPPAPAVTFTPFMVVFPIIAFIVGLFGSRGGRGPIGVFITLGLAFFNVVTTATRVGRFDIVGTILVPVLIIIAFVVGIAIRFLLRMRI